MSISFNKSNLTSLRGDITAALKDVEKKYDVTFLLGRITFTEKEFRGKLECRSGNGVTINQTRTNDLDNYGKMLLGASFTPNAIYHSAHGTVRIVDYRPRKHKYPFVVEVVNTGKKYIISVLQAQMLVRSKI